MYWMSLMMNSTMQRSLAYKSINWGRGIFRITPAPIEGCPVPN